MKTSLLLSLALIALPIAAAKAQHVQAPPQINVSGSAEVKVAPDEIRISVGVETRDANLDEAKHQHDERMKTALAFLKSTGVAEKDVQTDFISVQPEYDHNVSRTTPVVYIVRKSIEVKLTTVTNLEPVLTGLLNNGVNYIHNVDFRTTELRKYRDQARAMAIQAAKEKAEALCNELGVKRGKPNSINAHEGGGWRGLAGSHWGGRGSHAYFNVAQNVSQFADAPSDSPGETLSIGQISVSATVNVAFLME